jgi:hypothetical protein
MINKKILALLAVFTFIFAGCAAQQENDFILPEGITDVNNSLRLTPVEKVFSIRFGTEVIAENSSEYELLYFSDDTDVYLYMQHEEEWQPVMKREIIYHPSADMFVSLSTDESPFFSTVSVKPLLPDLDKKTKLRVLVIATVIENEQKTDQKVAAYIDLWVEP